MSTRKMHCVYNFYLSVKVQSLDVFPVLVLVVPVLLLDLALVRILLWIGLGDGQTRLEVVQGVGEPVCKSLS